MDGPALLARTLSTPAVEDSQGNLWQYHPRSSLHSSVACWGMVFDLLQQCPLLAEHVRQGRVGFDINHVLTDTKTGRRKSLDWVLGTPQGSRPTGSTFRDLASAYELALTERERDILEQLPELQRAQIGSMRLAVETKACMTAHLKARARLHDELDSCHLAVHAANRSTIAAGVVVVNKAETFCNAMRNVKGLGVEKPEVTLHRQPADAEHTIAMVREVPLVSPSTTEGFNALGVIVIDMANDGTAVTVSEEAPTPSRDDRLHYDRMLRSVAALYRVSFG